ncbi:MAG TPA: hypothetical protein VL361_20080 [Candidatus Limnocylindrales bacterium]|nr:hypothetical protein [Candidatus Limnocylindrales bacterium]
MTYPAALNTLCIQLNEFCLLFQRELLRRPTLPMATASPALARSFCESLILCPTRAAAEVCIRRDLAGARSFLVVADGLLRQLRRRRFQFAKECPPYQTRYYLLSCAVEEFSHPRRTVAATQPVCSQA